MLHLKLIENSEYIDISHDTTLIKQHQTCLYNTGHVYIITNLLNPCQHFYQYILRTPI